MFSNNHFRLCWCFHNCYCRPQFRYQMEIFHFRAVKYTHARAVRVVKGGHRLRLSSHAADGCVCECAGRCAILLRLSDRQTDRQTDTDRQTSTAQQDSEALGRSSSGRLQQLGRPQQLGAAAAARTAAAARGGRSSSGRPQQLGRPGLSHDTRPHSLQTGQHQHTSRDGRRPRAQRAQVTATSRPPADRQGSLTDPGARRCPAGRNEGTATPVSGQHCWRED